ncbi:MAG: hypothetical protein J7641_18500 [Cyanobacteria bacterium SID2]|nr:hypothetical protein [Cyanobacteria bacterium SID2]MBP0002218.1 hypothetical protein [Cyanobacteria bacterium SBC]
MRQTPLPMLAREFELLLKRESPAYNNFTTSFKFFTGRDAGVMRSFAMRYLSTIHVEPRDRLFPSSSQLYQS